MVAVFRGGCGQWTMGMGSSGGRRRCGEAATGIVVEDVLCCGRIGIVGEPPARDVAVDVWAYMSFSSWWALMLRGGGHEG